MKSRSQSIILAAGVLALCMLSQNANAQVSISSQCVWSGTGSTTCLPGSVADAPVANSHTGNYASGLTLSTVDAKSPYDGSPQLSAYGSPFSALDGTPTAVDSSATYIPTVPTDKGFQIIWGSPDLYNEISFYNGGTCTLGVCTGATDIGNFGINQLSNTVVAGDGFDLVKFSSTEAISSRIGGCRLN